MCGIVGCVTPEVLNPGLIEKLHQVQHHRGPDGRGLYENETEPHRHVTLLHQRLSIIDISDGAQPMSNSCGNLTIVFNGEIFNHLELRQKLIEKGYRFNTDHSDTEVLLNLYHVYQEKMLPFLNGMFNFVIYDRDNQILFGARDRVGIKPLYYSMYNGSFYFASELKTLLQFNISKEINTQSLSNYLSFQFVPAPDTIFSNIHKLQSAHYFVYKIKHQEFREQRYWALNFQHQNKSLPEWEETIRAQLEVSVKRWSLSDVEVGASLSGGLDSSSVVALFSQHTSRKIKTFSLGFDDEGEDLDELELARLVAKKYNTEHYEYILKKNDLIDELREMIYHLDEPYAGGLPSWYIYKMMQGKVKVALTGTGGDELFGNYNKARIYHGSKLAKLHRFYVLGKKNYWRALKAYITNSKGFFYHRYFSGFEIKQILCQQSLLAPELLLQKHINASKEIDYRNVVPYIDFKMQLPEEFLHVTDRFSMAHSIEARVPFLDHEMIEMAMSIPADMRTNFTEPKYLLKRAVSDLLPQALNTAPKRGFIVPEAKWIKSVLRDDVEYYLGKAYLQKQGIFSPSIYDRYVKPHIVGVKNYHWQIWTLLMFQLWYQRYV